MFVKSCRCKSTHHWKILLYSSYMIPGIILMVLGVAIFMYGIFQTRKNPGVETSHLVIILVSFVTILVGAILAYGEFINYLN